MKNKQCQAFSLVELSIVLLIIGLLIGGIMVGKDMIRAAELRSITTEKDQIQTAVMIFEQKYFAIPGDMPNATAFWGTMPTGTCNIATSSGGGASGGNGTQTCNGDGNGGVYTNESGSGVAPNAEILLFWQHLANAGLIKGNYTGVWTGTWGAAGQEMPGKIPNLWWFVSTVGVQPISDLSRIEGSYGLNLEPYLGDYSTGTLTAEEMWQIDKKIDDGLPGKGNMVAMEYGGIPCISVAASSSVALAEVAAYNLLDSSLSCYPNFRNIR